MVEDEDMADASTSSGMTVAPKRMSEEAILINEEFDALLNRDVLVRRGRNNRLFYKFISREVFQDESVGDFKG